MSSLNETCRIHVCTLAFVVLLHVSPGKAEFLTVVKMQRHLPLNVQHDLGRLTMTLSLSSTSNGDDAVRSYRGYRIHICTFVRC